MTSLAVKARRLIGIFLLGAILFNYPVLSLFDREIFLSGIPILYLYLFGVWALLILLTALVTGSRPLSALDYQLEDETDADTESTQHDGEFCDIEPENRDGQQKTYQYEEIVDQLSN